MQWKIHFGGRKKKKSVALLSREGRCNHQTKLLYIKYSKGKACNCSQGRKSRGEGFL